MSLWGTWSGCEVDDPMIGSTFYRQNRHRKKLFNNYPDDYDEDYFVYNMFDNSDYYFDDDVDDKNEDDEGGGGYQNYVERIKSEEDEFDDENKVSSWNKDNIKANNNSSFSMNNTINNTNNNNLVFNTKMNENVKHKNHYLLKKTKSLTKRMENRKRKLLSAPDNVEYIKKKSLLKVNRYSNDGYIRIQKRYRHIIALPSKGAVTCNAFVVVVWETYYKKTQFIYLKQYIFFLYYNVLKLT